MKKIVSLLLAVAVVLCLGVTSFATNAAPFSFKEDVKTVSVGEGTEDVTLVLKIDFDTTVSNASMAALMMEYDTSKLTLKSVDSSAFPIPYSSGASDLPAGLVTFANDADPSAEYEIAAGTTIEIPMTFAVDKSVEADYPIIFNSENTMIIDIDGGVINDLATYPTATISVKAAAPAVKTITPSATTKLTTDEFADGTKTDVQIGTAVGMKFEQPAGVTFTKMIWALTTDAGKRYSKAVDLNLSDVTGEVALGATFINGSHANEGMGITTAVTPLTINAVNAIFTDGTNNYFTDAADAAEQK